MKQYLELLTDIKTNGVFKGDRTGTGTQSVFGRQIRFDLSKGFPLVTTKTVHLKSIIVELLWFLQGNTNTRYLNANGCRIWDAWALTEEHTSTLSEQLVPTPVMEWVWEDMGKATPEKKAHIEKIWEEYGKVEGESMVREYLQKDGIRTHHTFEELGHQNGDLGSVYGKQWRSWACPDGSTIDQISELIQLLKTKPDSRRLIVSAWNPADLPDESISPQDNVLNGKMALAACHTLFQFYSETIPLFATIAMCEEQGLGEELNKEIAPYLGDDGIDNMVKTTRAFAERHGVPTRKLSCQLYQRSADVFLGVPYNIASYALLTHMVAQQCNMVVGEFIHTFGDVHVYSNLQEQVELQLTREPRPLPKLIIKRKPDDIFSYTLDDFELEGYDPHPAIKGQVAV